MESSAATASSLDDDPRLALIRERHTELSNQVESLNRLNGVGSTARMSHVFQYIESTFFYETLAQFGFSARLKQFYSSLHVGERFVAKVSNVFERSADLLLLWSPKRDIRDLKIKAYLRLVESKRYNGHGHNGSRYCRQSREILPNENLDVSDIIFVEFVQLKGKNRELEVARCKSLSASSDAHVDDQNVDDALLSEDKYRAESPSRLSFQEYMMHHRDLQNPALIKRPGFTSILHHKQVIESYRRKFEKDCNEEKPNQSTTKSAQNDDDDDVIILEEHKVDKSIPAYSDLQYQNDPLSQESRSPTLPSNYKRSSMSIHSGNQPVSITPHRNHSLKTKSHISVRSRSTSSSSSSSSSSSDTSSSSSSNSSEPSRKRHKRSHKKYKSKNRHEKHHTRRSKKRSKKSKKKKSNRERGNSPGKKSRSPKRKKIDHKILELLNKTK